MPIEIVNRRGSDKEETVARPILNLQRPQLEKPAEKVRDRYWIGKIDYLIGASDIKGEQFISGRAAGIRSDEIAFCTDIILPVHYPEGYDWTKMAREHLETWLNCECNLTTICSFHSGAVGEWLLQGLTAIQELMSRPMPPSIMKLTEQQQKAMAAGGAPVSKAIVTARAMPTRTGPIPNPPTSLRGLKGKRVW
jgi:hypothetical protein